MSSSSPCLFRRKAYFPVAADAPRKMLLQGVIDCLIETRDGFVILDFKTDRIKKGGAVES